MADSNNESRLRRTRELIAALHDLDSEVIVPSEGEPFVESRDPHLRLRRTLTPPSPFQGCSPEEAQFMISGSTGQRVSLSFSCLGDYQFSCDGYFFGAREEEATKRIFAVQALRRGLVAPVGMPSASDWPRRTPACASVQSIGIRLIERTSSKKNFLRCYRSIFLTPLTTRSCSTRW